jgi:hypothetical protein
MEGFNWDAVFNWVIGLSPIANYVLMGLGAIVVLGTFIDSIIPDEKDGGFMTKILAIPILGSFLAQLKKFSPFNYK